MPPPPSSGDALPDARWDSARSRVYSFELPLPDRRGWAVGEASERWWHARHERSGSDLRVRIWREGRMPERAACERQARLWSPELPETDPSSVIERREVEQPPGFRSELVVGVTQAGAEIRAFALMFGVSPHRCFALAFRTKAKGTGADAAIGRRLGLIVGGSVRKLELFDISDRAGRQPPPL